MEKLSWSWYDISKKTHRTAGMTARGREKETARIMGFGSQGQKKRKRRDEIRWGHSLAMTGILIVLILVASFGAMRCINQMEEERCFERLYEEANALAGDIEMYAGNDEEQLELLAGVIARYDDFSSP